MKTLILLLSVISSLVGAAAASQEKSDLEKIKGDWVLLSFEKEGRTEPAKKDMVITFTFEDNKLTMKQSKMEFEKAVFKIDPSKKPKEMDLFMGKKGIARAKAIYLLDGDSLRICLTTLVPLKEGEEEKPRESAKRPTEFTGKGDQMLFILKRQAP